MAKIKKNMKGGSKVEGKGGKKGPETDAVRHAPATKALTRGRDVADVRVCRFARSRRRSASCASRLRR